MQMTWNCTTYDVATQIQKIGVMENLESTPMTRARYPGSLCVTQICDRLQTDMVLLRAKSEPRGTGCEEEHFRADIPRVRTREVRSISILTTCVPVSKRGIFNVGAFAKSILQS